MLNIPFFANTADDLHCWQATLKSILACAFPARRYSFRALDKATGHTRGRGTWIGAVYALLARLGFDVIVFEAFDYRAFAREGDAYLQRYWTDEIYQAHREKGNIRTGQRAAQRLAACTNVRLLRRPATLQDIDRQFRQGCLLIARINPFVLDGRTGFANHVALLTDVTRSHVTFHDSGLPPVKNRKATRAQFWRAMCVPNAQSADLAAVRLHSGRR